MSTPTHATWIILWMMFHVACGGVRATAQFIDESDPWDVGGRLSQPLPPEVSADDPLTYPLLEDGQSFFEPPGDGDLLGPLIDDPIARVRSRDRAPLRIAASAVPRRSVRRSGDSLSTRVLSAQLAVPLRITDGGITAATLGIKHIGFSTDAVLPVSGTPIPDDLWDARGGLLFTRTREDGKTYGGLLNIGSASDRPFETGDEWTLGTLAFLSVPVGRRDSWEFGLFYSPTSQIAFPIPGVAYRWRPSDVLEMQVGFPASLIYTPTSTFSFRASYTPVTDVLIEARQDLTDRWSWFGRYQIVNETYWLADREERRDRLFLFEQQLATGLARQLPAGFSLDFTAAYLFDRQIFVSDNFDLRSRDSIKIDPGPALTVQLVWVR